MSEVILVNIPDRKEAIYLDGNLILEDKWISCTQLFDKLVQWGVINGGRRYADEAELNDVGQFPRTLVQIKVREKRYV
jgi:hypothetical protein